MIDDYLGVISKSKCPLHRVWTVTSNLSPAAMSTARLIAMEVTLAGPSTGVDDDGAVLVEQITARSHQVGPRVRDHHNASYVILPVVHDIAYDAGPGVRRTG